MLLLLKNVLFTVLVPGTVAVFVPLYYFSHADFGTPARSVSAGMLLFLGAAIYAWCLWDFAITGGGTPAPIDAPKKLVVRGLYRYTRNPMYVGVLTVILGWAVLFQAAAVGLYGVIVGSGFHLFIVLYEERQLQQEFGGEYEDYRRRVSRWVPRLRHR